MHIVSVNKILFYANKYDLHMNNKHTGKLYLFLLERFSIAINFYLLFGISDGLFDFVCFKCRLWVTIF